MTDHAAPIVVAHREAVTDLANLSPEEQWQLVTAAQDRYWALLSQIEDLNDCEICSADDLREYNNANDYLECHS